MKVSFRSSISLVLAMLMCSATVLTACSEASENADDTTSGTSTNTTPSNSDEETSDEEETVRLYADVPADSNFDGYTFTILCSSNSEYGIVQNDFHAEEITGEAINDARFNRLITVSDKLNITITDVETASSGSDQGYNYVVQDVTAGTHSYDLATCCGYATSKLSMTNYLYDMTQIPYIDLEAPWWDQVANESLKVLDQLFYTTGDLTTSDNDATYCILFNKQLITDYDYEDPYQLVNDGKWTIDQFITMASAVTGDLDGNGLYNEADRYGALIWDDSMMGIVNCSGEKCTNVNDEGLLELTLNTEKTIDILDKFLTFASNKQVACAYQRLNWTDALLVNMFCGDQALFLMQLIQIVPKLREMDTDFGILPYFKYTEAQEKYYTTIGSWHSVFVCIPNNSQDDISRTGIITEVLANESLYGLTEAYYEKTLKGKTTRDVESSAMLDIIFANRVYDIGWYFQFGSYNENVMNLFRNNQNNFASMYKTSEKAAAKLVSRTNEAFIESKAAQEAANP